VKPRDLKTLQAMNKFGGGFVKCLAGLMLVADDGNQERLEDAFPEIFARYKKMAMDLEQYDKEEQV